MKYICPVCGYDELIDDPKEISCHEICPCCNFQYGVSDRDKGFSYEQWRNKWIGGGMIWDKGDSSPHENWNPQQQLLNVGIKLPI